MSRLSLATPTLSTDILRSLAPVPAAVAAARHTLQERGLHPELDQTVALLASELVGNAIRHSGSAERIVFHTRVTRESVRVEVTDQGPGFDPDVRHHAEGFGLRIVDRLADRWGVERTARGCRVWFEIDRDVESPRPAAV